jgi:hypothetical protein
LPQSPACFLIQLNIQIISSRQSLVKYQKAQDE